MDAYLSVVSKREVREYDGRPLGPEVERKILDAGRVSGSAQNRQPWEFIVIRDAAARDAVAEAVYEAGNVRGAGFLVAIRTTGGPPLDAGRVMQNMMLAAWALGVGSCPNGVADRDALNGVLGLGEDDKVAVVLSFGYPARERDPERRTAEEWVRRARRKPFEDVVREV